MRNSREDYVYMFMFSSFFGIPACVVGYHACHEMRYAHPIVYKGRVPFMATGIAQVAVWAAIPIGIVAMGIKNEYDERHKSDGS